MNKQDEDKAREIAEKNEILYTENNICESDYKNLLDTSLEMAAWKEQQMIEKACYWFEKNWTMYTYPSHLMFEDFKKYMEENND